MLTLWLSKVRTCECLLWKWLFPRSSSHSFPQKYLGSLAASGIYSCRLHLMAISCCKYTEFLTGFESVSRVEVTFLGHRPLEMLFNWEGGNLIRGLIYLAHGLAFSPLYLMFLNVPKSWREQEECLSSGVCGLCLVICVTVKVVRYNPTGHSDLDHTASLVLLPGLFVIQLIDMSMTCWYHYRKMKIYETGGKHLYCQGQWICQE